MSRRLYARACAYACTRGPLPTLPTSSSKARAQRSCVERAGEPASGSSRNRSGTNPTDGADSLRAALGLP